MSASEKSLREQFMNYIRTHANFNEDLGHCDWVDIEDLIAIDPRFATGNGGSWCRSDGPLKQYRIDREKGERGRIVRVRLTGKNGNPVERQIAPAIYKEISKRRCVVLDVGKVEVDHKDGRYEETRRVPLAEQKESDFQPLSKHANTAKRSHCKKCKETGERYDARRLGYATGWLGAGDSSYKQWGCTGCYWYDPKYFNEMVSKKG